MIRSLLSLGSLIAIFCITSAAQTSIPGVVSEVVDGRTIVIDSSAGKMRIQMQYIEVPAVDQAFASVVKGHLERLALGKAIGFRPVRLSDNVSIGQVSLAGVDLGLQMIRDGAAWHEPANLSGQDAASFAEYADNQQKARAENRGVWAAKDLKTPTQLRAEHEAALARADSERRSKRSAKVGLGEFQSDNRGLAEGGPRSTENPGLAQVEAWADMFTAKANEGYGVHTYTDPNGRFDAIYTSSSFVDLNGGPQKQRIECRLVYYVAKLPDGSRPSWYALYFRSIMADYHFSKRKSRLTITADKRNYAIGPPYTGVKGEQIQGNHELFFYRLARSPLQNVAKAKSIEFRIDGLSGTLSSEARDLFKQLVEAMN